jgi:SAM-dependent methyltransferase
MTGGDGEFVQCLFDAKAASWSAKYAAGGRLAGRLASLSGAIWSYTRTGDRVLDLGCGTGELAHALSGTGMRVTGCDISHQMLRRAAAGVGSWVLLDPGWRGLPFAAAAFDVVVASSVLEYVTEPCVVLRECARVLRPGGVVLYTVPDLRHPVRWAEWFARRVAHVTPPLAGRARSYRAYLLASRQRHRLLWWQTASASAGLELCQADDDRSALRLLVFRRPGWQGAYR